MTKLLQKTFNSHPTPARLARLVDFSLSAATGIQSFLDEVKKRAALSPSGATQIHNSVTTIPCSASRLLLVFFKRFGVSILFKTSLTMVLKDAKFGRQLLPPLLPLMTAADIQARVVGPGGENAVELNSVDVQRALFGVLKGLLGMLR
jgi:hypothetical protein